MRDFINWVNRKNYVLMWILWKFILPLLMKHSLCNHWRYSSASSISADQTSLRRTMNCRLSSVRWKNTVTSFMSLARKCHRPTLYQGRIKWLVKNAWRRFMNIFSVKRWKTQPKNYQMETVYFERFWIIVVIDGERMSEQPISHNE